MTTFLTKVWGFDAPCGPLQFGESGWRDRARQLLAGGNHRVILVGTLGPMTAEHQRGCILGMMEPTTEPVGWLDFKIETREEDFTHGQYRWPYGLHNRRAWRFLEPYTRLKDLTDRKFTMDAAAGIVAIDDDLATRIFALPHDEVDLLPLVAAAEARIGTNAKITPRRAPPPSTTRTGIMHMRRAPASTYAFRIEGATGSFYKIGWAFDHEQRRRQFNHAALPVIGGLHYKGGFTQLWDTARQAFAMEQAIFVVLDCNRLNENHEVVQVSQQELQTVWTRAVQG